MKSLRKAGNVMILSGAVLISGAAGLWIYNVKTSDEAEKASEFAVSAFFSYAEEEKSEAESSPHIPSVSEACSAIYSRYSVSAAEIPEEPVFENEGTEWLAVIEIPVLELSLPVCSELTMDNLKLYPCRYTGTVSENNIIIAAHNYESHFGNIKKLQQGDEIYYTDASGEKTLYAVTETEVIPGNDTEAMKNGSWDMTLFSCDISGRSRITVRCVKK